MKKVTSDVDTENIIDERDTECLMTWILTLNCYRSV